MDWGYFFNVWIVFSILLIIQQRISQRHQRKFMGFIIVFALVWISWRIERFLLEMMLAFVASVLVSALFWLLIGRYNPVGNADEEAIKVIGLDD